VFRPVIGVSGFLLAALLVFAAGSRLAAGPRLPPLKLEPTYVPDSPFLRAVSLGYHNVAADVLWFHTTSYFGKHLRRTRSYPWLARMCDIITDLDPRAEHVYRFAGAILPWEAKQPEEGARLLGKGASALPESWVLSYLAGFTYHFFLDDHARAIEYMQQAARNPNASPFVRKLLTKLMAKKGAAESAVAFLEELSRGTQNADVRRSIEEQLKEARFARALEIVDEAAARFGERHGRPPASTEEILASGLLQAVPADPSGGVVYWDPERGEARSSSGHPRLRLYESPARRELRNRMGS